MAELNYLWNNRARFPFGSKEFLRAWAKRILTFNSLINRNSKKRKLVRAGASISGTAEIGDVMAAGNKKNLSVGDNSFVGQVELALHDRISIGNHVCINDGVKLLTASHDVADSSWRHKKGAITIGDYAWIATNAILLPGISIGRGAVVGAGAVVSKDVPSGYIVIGNPAVVIEKKRVETLDYNPCEFIAANRAWLVG